MVFAGIGWRRCDFLANCFCDSFEAEAVIPCPRDDRGRVSDAAAGATRDREQDLFRSRLDRIIDLTHALVKLSRAIEWRFLEAQFGSVYSDGPGYAIYPQKLPTTSTWALHLLRNCGLRIGRIRRISDRAAQKIKRFFQCTVGLFVRRHEGLRARFFGTFCLEVSAQ